ncbi:MAG: hypothetical protein K2X87_00295 [Gemmataceae bacterium]|nr:hypothetical protein [Gemmataceae bacterium]
MSTNVPPAVGSRVIASWLRKYQLKLAASNFWVSSSSGESRVVSCSGGEPSRASSAAATVATFDPWLWPSRWSRPPAANDGATACPTAAASRRPFWVVWASDRFTSPVRASRLLMTPTVADSSSQE